MSAPVQLEIRCVAQRSRRRLRLRSLLADKRWHTTAELLHVAGSGVSSRIHELRTGADGMPALEIECQREPGGTGWRYRLVGEFIPGANLDGGRAEAFRVLPRGDLASMARAAAGGDAALEAAILAEGGK